MAAGTFTLFEQFSAEISTVHDLDADTIKLAIITSVVAPQASDDTASPFARYTQVTTGGNYAAGGQDISAVFTEADGLATLDDDGTNAVWAAHAGNPTDARWAILYNDTAANDNAIGWFDLGGVTDMVPEGLTLGFHANGILTVA